MQRKREVGEEGWKMAEEENSGRRIKKNGGGGEG